MRDVKAEIIADNSYSEYIEKGPLKIIGTASSKIQKLLQPALTRNIQFHEEFPSARNMGVLAENKYKISNFENVAYFEPYYLKDFVAIKPKSLF